MRILLVGRREQVRDWLKRNTIWGKAGVDLRSHLIRGAGDLYVDFYWCRPEAWEDLAGVYVHCVIHLGTPIAYRQFFDRLIRAPSPS